ncbi:MAG: hypothetical protein HFE73_02355 [Firmicutes bacterium]|nr:hypothetical protein [Bacillota bacterium]
MKRYVSVLVCLCLLFAACLPQTVFGAEEEPAKIGNLKPWGNPEVADPDAIRIYWGMDSISAKQEYRISWKKAEENTWNSVDIQEAKQEKDGSKSYLITGLAQNQKYDITVETVLRNEKGEKVYSQPIVLQGYTYVQAPKYEAYSATSDGSYIESVWNVYEKNGILKVYRADKKDGEYVLVGQTDGREDLVHTNFKYTTGKVVFRDETVKPGKTYYYKAESQVSLDDGTVLQAESPKSYQLTSRKKPYGDYKIELLNKKGTYAKTLTWKITADKANYLTNLVKKDVSILAKSSKTGKTSYKKPAKVQWSADGKTWRNMKSTLAIYQGKTVYLRVKLNNKMWIRKDGADVLKLGLRYYYYDRMGRDHWLDLRVDMNNKIKLESANEGDDPGYIDDNHGPGEAENWENIYKMFHSHGVAYEGDLTVKATENGSAVLNWRLCPMAEGYILRYGRTEEEAQKAQPILLPANQFGYEVKDLERGQAYYFIMTEKYRDEETGKLEEDEREYGTTLLPTEGWQMVGRTYHGHLKNDLHGNVHNDDETAVILVWDRCSEAEGYKVYYGTSEEEAKAGVPIVIDEKWTENCVIKNLKKGKTYYFFVSEITKDEKGTLHEDYRPHGKLAITIPA